MKRGGAASPASLPYFCTFLFYRGDPMNIPVWEKENLTLTEAADYYNIGIHKLRELTNDENCPYVLYVGNRRLIKRKLFSKFIESSYSI